MEDQTGGTSASWHRALDSEPDATHSVALMNEEVETYAEKLPRPVKGKSCQSLAPNGELCGKPAAFECSLHGDPGMHEDAWAAVFLCEEHAKLMDRQIFS